MKESDKGMKGDHRNLSDPTADRKDFIKHVEDNAAKTAAKDKDKNNDKYKDKVKNLKQ